MRKIYIYTKKRSTNYIYIHTQCLCVNACTRACGMLMCMVWYVKDILFLSLQL